MTLAAARPIAYSHRGVARGAHARGPARSGPRGARSGARRPSQGASQRQNGRVALAHLPRLPPLVVEPKAVTDTVLVAGRIATNLYAALDSCAATTFPLRARWKLAWSVADILEYRVDMSRDLRVGDGFRVLVERAFDPDRWVPHRTRARAHIRRIPRYAHCDSFPRDGVAERISREPILRSARTIAASGVPPRPGGIPADLERIRNAPPPDSQSLARAQGHGLCSPAGTPVRAIGDGT